MTLYLVFLRPLGLRLSTGDTLTVYTTRPDTLFGATYMVISPEHPIIEKWADKISNMDEVKAYQAEAAKKSDFERTELADKKEKTGVEIKGVRAVNPVNNKEIPIFISDYVLITYGTGAIMAVPAHDTRDWDFAKKFNLPIIEVVAGGNVEEEAFTDVATGKMVNSGFLDGLEVAEAKVKITEFLTKENKGHKKVNFKLRDWVFSRQRYWGEPIPLIYCEKCGWVAVPEDQLPLTLPEVSSYEPGADGESPLASLDSWVKCKCPKCGGDAERETDTMPQWAGSSWYFLRYCDPFNDKALASKEALEYWMPVDWYNGGMEHTTLHLLYSRFWSKFLYDEGILSKPEPYAKRTSHGMILGENGEKMSKSRGNVVNPDDIINEYGADTMRLYEMFIGDFEKAAPWSSQGIKGCKRFLDRFSAMCDLAKGNGVTESLETSFHKTIKKVTEDIDNLKANTAIAAMMALLNDVCDAGTLTLDELNIFTRLLCPFAPHLAEEVWENVLHCDGFCSLAKWPEYDESKTVDSTVEVAVQICGKLKGTINLAADCDKDTALALVKADERFAKLIEGKTIVKEIVVPGRLINIVVR